MSVGTHEFGCRPVSTDQTSNDGIAPKRAASGSLVEQKICKSDPATHIARKVLQAAHSMNHAALKKSIDVLSGQARIARVGFGVYQRFQGCIFKVVPLKGFPNMALT